MLCSVEFVDNISKSYYPGNTIFGNLIVILKHEKHIESLKVHIKGRAVISYDDGSKFLSFRERFVDEKITIVSDIILPEGDHSFPFETVLPENCPPSFKGKYGYILYEVIIIVPKMIFHEKVPFEFTVLSKVIIPSAMERKLPLTISIDSTKKVNTIFSNNHFKLGEYILIHIEDSRPNKKKKMKFLIVRKVSFQTSKGCCGRRREICSEDIIVKFPIVTYDSSYKLSVRIPEDIPTSLENNELIKITFILKIKINKKKMKFPLVLGNQYGETNTVTWASHPNQGTMV